MAAINRRLFERGPTLNNRDEIGNKMGVNNASTSGIEAYRRYYFSILQWWRRREREACAIYVIMLALSHELSATSVISTRNAAPHASKAALYRSPAGMRATKYSLGRFAVGRRNNRNRQLACKACRGMACANDNHRHVPAHQRSSLGFMTTAAGAARRVAVAMLRPAGETMCYKRLLLNRRLVAAMKAWHHHRKSPPASRASPRRRATVLRRIVRIFSRAYETGRGGRPAHGGYQSAQHAGRWYKL